MDPKTPETNANTETEPVDLDAGLLAAVNQAIDGDATAKPADTPAEDETATAATDDAATATASDAEGGEETGEIAEPDADGKPKEQPAAAKEGVAGDKPAAAAAKPEDKPTTAAKAADPVNDPIPEEVKGRTRERMETLISRVKSSEQEVSRIRTERDDLVGMVTDTGATPQQFNETLQYLQAVNSGDPTLIRGAIQKVQAELVALSRMIGEPVPGVDALANHADLRQAVEAGDLSSAHAQEIAAARDARAFQTRRQQQTTEAQRQEQAEAQAIQQGVQSLNNLERQLQTDSDFGRKRAILIPTLQPVLAQLPPSQWAQTFLSAYQQLKVGPAPAAAAAPAATPQQPLRARQPAGGPVKAPNSMLDAVNAGIERAARR